MDQVLAGLRPYNNSDIEPLARLLIAAEAWPPVAPPAPADISLRWQRRNVRPEHDVNILPGPDGELAGFSQSVLFKDGTPRLSFEIAVHPRFRRQGVGSALYRLTSLRAHELGVNHLTAPVYVRPGEAKLESTHFLERRGFRAEHSYWMMRLDNIAAHTCEHWPDGFACRVFSDEHRDAEIWADLVVGAFNEAANPAGIRMQLSEPGVSPDGYFFAVDTATGREIGTSRGRIDVQAGRQIGYIGTVGVLPEYRGRGIARALMAQTLAYLQARGMESATLFVEDRNTVARGLYQKLGWQSVYRTDHFWKRLGQ